VEGKKQLILLEGNVASGKSTLGKKLEDSRLFGFIEEPVGAWQEDFDENLLDLFYNDMERWAFTFQLAAFATRAKTWTEVLAKTNHRNVVLERSIYCDRYVFAKNCYQSGLIKKTEWELYCKLWDWLESNWCTSPDVILYLRTPADVCLKRVHIRGRIEEDAVEIDYLNKLEALHDDWLLNTDRVIIMDGEKEWTAPEVFDLLIEHNIDMWPGGVDDVQ